jgi:protein DGCR14
MFPPDADVDPHAYKPPPEGTVPRAIAYANTRLDAHDARASRGGSAPPSPTHSRIAAAVAGTPYRPCSPPGTFGFVPALPSPTPEQLGPAAVKQLMTWGALDATPRVLDAGAGADSPFHLAAPSAREALSLRLSDKAAKDIRARAGRLTGTPRVSEGATPRGSALGRRDMPPPARTPARGALTPAARRLLDRTTLGGVGGRRAEAMDRAAGWDAKKDLSRVRWTPTPSPVTRRAP